MLPSPDIVIDVVHGSHAVVSFGCEIRISVADLERRRDRLAWGLFPSIGTIEILRGGVRIADWDGGGEWVLRRHVRVCCSPKYATLITPVSFIAICEGGGGGFVNRTGLRPSFPSRAT
jgi:hypothetical protein